VPVTPRAVEVTGGDTPRSLASPPVVVEEIRMASLDNIIARPTTPAVAPAAPETPQPADTDSDVSESASSSEEPVAVPIRGVQAAKLTEPLATDLARAPVGPVVGTLPKRL
jgi:hypothetical protein